MRRAALMATAACLALLFLASACQQAMYSKDPNLRIVKLTVPGCT